MHSFPPLDAMGPRIVVLGPTNAGKSTLALALKSRLRIAVVHLDQLRHLPNTDWQIRPDNEFARLHDEAIAADSWIMEGNYTRLAQQRLARATGIIVIDENLLIRYRRYFYRTLWQKTRPGSLEGGQDHLNWGMMGWLWKSRNAASAYRRLAQSSSLPYVIVHNRAELAALYVAWGLPPISRGA